MKFLLLLCALFLAPSAGADTTVTGTLHVLGASSLSDVLPRIADSWGKGHPGTKVLFSFDGSSRLARQIESGVPADLFFSADEEWMDYLEKKHLIDARSRADIAGNKLVLIVPVSAGRGLQEPKDLLSYPIRHFALAGENVPISKYATESLRKLGLWDAVKAEIVRGDNTRTSLSWVSSGQADAGVVYATDARGDRGVRVAFTFAPSSHSPVRYPGAFLPRRGGSETDAKMAKDFLEYCRSPEARAILKDAGFSR